MGRMKYQSSLLVLFGAPEVNVFCKERGCCLEVWDVARNTAVRFTEEKSEVFAQSVGFLIF